MAFCCFADNARFDASQYAFFGSKDVLEEVELGGLEDDDGSGAGLVGLDDEEYRFPSTGDIEEVSILYRMFYLRHH